MSVATTIFKNRAIDRLVQFMNRLILPDAFADLMPTTSITNEVSEEGDLIYKNVHYHLIPTLIYKTPNDKEVLVNVWLQAEHKFERPYYKSNEWITFNESNIESLEEVLLNEFNNKNENNIEKAQRLLSEPNFYLGDIADYSKQTTLQALLFPKERFPHESSHDITIVITKFKRNEKGDVKEAVYDMVRNNIIIKKDLRSWVYNDSKYYVSITGANGRSIYIEEFQR